MEVCESMSALDKDVSDCGNVVMNNLVLEPGIGAILNAGVNTQEPISSVKLNSHSGTRDFFDNATASDQRAVFGAAIVKMETTKPKNPWQRPEHIQIVQAKENIAISKDGVMVDLYMEAVNENIQLLDRVVVGRILGKRLPYFVLSSEIKFQWGRFGEYQLSTIRQDCFVCIFSSLEARDVVLCGGP
ncbi:hypothetical protein M5K25_003655 [Dendrobium thyrsiflorum]|uniref:Uncharacterized protein n=1 Tax=Dendrobium thyrsiflorum TaxID=117978 RepID=A0ABD0VK19_DENTH